MLLSPWCLMWGYMFLFMSNSCLGHTPSACRKCASFECKCVSLLWLFPSGQFLPLHLRNEEEYRCLLPVVRKPPSRAVSLCLCRAATWGNEAPSAGLSCRGKARKSVCEVCVKFTPQSNHSEMLLLCLQSGNQTSWFKVKFSWRNKTPLAVLFTAKVKTGLYPFL